MKKIAMMVGSVYGGAEYVAEQALPLLQQKGYQVEWFQPAALDAVLAFNADYWLLISSTTGQGDIPDNLFPFYAECRDRFPLLTNKRFAVLALGDSSYGDTFCAAGHQLFELMQELQGTAMAPMLEIDAGETLQAEDIALPWLSQHF